MVGITTFLLNLRFQALRNNNIVNIQAGFTMFVDEITPQSCHNVELTVLIGPPVCALLRHRVYEKAVLDVGYSLITPCDEVCMPNHASSRDKYSDFNIERDLM